MGNRNVPLILKEYEGDCCLRGNEAKLMKSVEWSQVSEYINNLTSTWMALKHKNYSNFITYNSGIKFFGKKNKYT